MVLLDSCSDRIRLYSRALRRRFVPRKEIQAYGKDVCDLFFPDAHLKVDESVRFQGVAKCYQFLHQVCHGFGR